MIEVRVDTFSCGCEGLYNLVMEVRVDSMSEGGKG